MRMPLVEKLSPYLWEFRTKVPDGIARVVFTVYGQLMVLLHGFINEDTEDSPEGNRRGEDSSSTVSGG